MNHAKINDLLSRIHFFLAIARQRWATAGWNESLGLFEDGLDFEGNQSSLLKTYRLRSQMRQIYVFAQGYAQTGNEDYFFLAKNAFQSCIKYFTLPMGGMCNTVDQKGDIIDGRISTFEQAFVIFSSAWMFHITDDALYLQTAENAFECIEAHLKDLNTDGFESYYPLDSSPLQQNAHMHLLEAALFSFLLTADEKWLCRANKYYSLFIKYLYLHDVGVVSEQFGHAFSSIAASEQWECGHSGEWIWLLNLYGRISGEKVSPIIDKLYAVMTQYGVNSEGLAYDLISTKMQVLQSTHRLWAQCEMLKGYLIVFENSKDEKILEKILFLVDQLFEKFLDEEKGLWSEQINDKDEKIYPYVPATSFYHLNMVFHEMQRVLMELVTPKCQCHEKGGCHE